MLERKIGKTEATTNDFKQWDGKAWLSYHLAWLKGSYQMAQEKAIKEEKAERPKKEKQKPYVNILKKEAKHLKERFSRRQMRKQMTQARLNHQAV